MGQKAELVLDVKSQLGEGPLWLEAQGTLTWVDIEGRRIEFYHPGTGDRRHIDVGERIGAVVETEDGRLLCALKSGLYYVDPSTAKKEAITNPEPNKPDNRFNDGKCDPAGRFWIGTMPTKGDTPEGALYMLDRDGAVYTKVQEVGCSNGLGWSLDGTSMYYIDSPTKRVDLFDFDMTSGQLSGRRCLVEIPDGLGYPDGMTVDAEGMIWVAHWSGSCVTRWSPATGELLERVELPVSQVTSCTFGGPNLDVLYITSARIGLSEEQLEKEPLAGGVFRYIPGVKGLPATKYKNL